MVMSAILMVLLSESAISKAWSRVSMRPVEPAETPSCAFAKIGEKVIVAIVKILKISLFIDYFLC